MMNCLKKYILTGSMALVAVLPTFSRQSVLDLSDYAVDSMLVYPESVETDVHKMMHNWYIENYTALDKDVELTPDPTTTDEEIVKRLHNLHTIIDMPFNSVVRAYIDLYTSRKRGLVETMLGMSLYYNPIFETALERNNVPLELKYLPVIESAINPDAVSRAGATGLWQFMLPTARGLGLEVSSLVDERRDPHKSSEAAARYLRQLYDIYHDWSLAIAAYNCGPGNVNKALRRCNEERKDFWAIYPFLPAETRGYVPCFIAAVYVMNYYNLHAISPALAKRPILTDSVHVTKRVHFQQIADVLKIPVEEIQVLNPQYREKIIPGDTKPYSLVLPSNLIYAYIMSEDAIVAHDAEKYSRRDYAEPSTGLSSQPAVVDGQEGEWVTTEDVKWHKVRKNETLTSVARRYGVTANSIKRANGNISKLRRGQTIKIVTTKKVFKAKEAPKSEEPAETQQSSDACEENNAASENSTETAPTNSAETTADNETAEETEDVEDTEASDSDDSAEEAEPQYGNVANEQKIAQATESKVADTFKTTAESAAASKPAASQPAAKSAAPQYYKVRSGDSLNRIAKKYGTTVAKLQNLNPKIKGGMIHPGDNIRVR